MPTLLLPACSDSRQAGPIAQDASVDVAEAAPVVDSFGAEPMVVEEGGTVTLTWNVTDASAELRLGPTHEVVEGTSTTVQPRFTTTYTLTASNQLGSDSATVTVVVVPAATATTRTTVAAQETAISWVDSAGNLAGLSSECGNLSGVFARTTADDVIASVALQGLWKLQPGSRDQWAKIGQGGDTITNRATAIVDDPQNPATYWESGMYNDGGVYRTDDGGATFRRLGDVEHIDLVSVDFSDPARRTLLAGVHEQPVLFRSQDGGQTWTNISSGLPRNVGHAAAPLVLDSTTFLLGSWAASESGIYRSTDAGATWAPVFDVGVRGAPLMVPSANGAPPTIYWLLESGLGIIKSTDLGLTWGAAGRGPTANESASLHLLPDGRLVALAGQQLITSADGGRTWTRLGPPLPYAPNGFTYAPAIKAFYAWRFDCIFDSTNPVPADAVIRLDLVDDVPDAPPPPVTAGQGLVRDSGVAAGEIVIHGASDGSLPFARGLLGLNVPAWVPPTTLRDDAFKTLLGDLGVTVVRMPGGSWSSEYDWVACESGDCAWSNAATPSDFAELLEGAAYQGMWTVSFNGTAQEAAALVAFFNGDVTDVRPIGVDRRGVDWKTVGHWAQLRADGGHPSPVRVQYWEVGNEVFGAVPSAGEGCAEFGWELVWTCDGAAYVQGDGEHDGFLAFRDAMRAVDPQIAVGAVGIGGPQSEWGGFGDEVIGLAGAQMDFYVVHDYGFDQTPPTVGDVTSRPQSAWTDVIDPVLSALRAGAPRASVGITEYNLFATQDGDLEGQMAEAVNALYLADMIGAMAASGVGIANVWNVMNGPTSTGSDYGLLDLATREPNPGYYPLGLWARMAPQLTATGVGFDRARELNVYAATGPDGTITILVINKTEQPLPAAITLSGVDATMSGAARAMTATGLGAGDVTYNGARNPTDLDASLSSFPATPTFDYEFPATSLTLLTLAPG